jgi:L,D-peptidoglycan transpeptidase YkuD (ErfK/YbiS/YcfS/YnhG family)
MVRRLLFTALVVAATACGSDKSQTRSLPTTVPTVATTTITTPAATGTTGGASTTVTAHAAQPASSAFEVPELRGVSGGQAVVVQAAGAGRTTATLAAYERSGDRWRVAFGPWAANVGRAGVAPPGEKREGDGRTPSGRYGFDFMFGVDPDPGVRFAFRRVTGPNIVWDDDPPSPRYNQWVDTNEADAGVNPEPMYVRPQYALGVVIAYNTARTPGIGSAIFLHVSAGRPTAGCVSLPRDQLTRLLLWLDPARSPVVAIGVGA